MKIHAPEGSHFFTLCGMRIRLGLNVTRNERIVDCLKCKKAMAKRAALQGEKK